MGLLLQQKWRKKCMRNIWFKAKRYGYGWTPYTWEGWLVFFIFLIGICFQIVRIAKLAEEQEQAGVDVSEGVHALHGTFNSAIIYNIAGVFLLVAAMIVICILKGEKARWRWGGVDESK
jgi:hypothetical protein